jgi:hypothetical protein
MFQNPGDQNYGSKTGVTYAIMRIVCAAYPNMIALVYNREFLATRFAMGIGEAGSWSATLARVGLNSLQKYDCDLPSLHSLL